MLHFLSSPCKRFIPFIIIPLVAVYNKNNITINELPKSYADFIHPQYNKRYSIGGTNNSAGESVFKSLWCRYGEEFTKIFIKNSNTYTMPAAAYNSVKTGKTDFAIVPTIFSDRSNKDLGQYIPDEGIIPIPSYIAIKNGIDISMYKNNILTDELQKQLFKSANVITTFKGNSYKKDDFFTASWDFLYKLDHNYFYKAIMTSIS